MDAKVRLKLILKFSSWDFDVGAMGPVAQNDVGPTQWTGPIAEVGADGYLEVLVLISSAFSTRTDQDKARFPKPGAMIAQ